jgi:hypothetical protein
MYELTESEGLTLLTVLARAGENTHRGLEGRSLPSSTFYSVRRRAYEAGWLSDRYVPNPWVNGFSAVECLLAKPSAPDFAAWGKKWAADPENVVLWIGLNSIFGLFFRRNLDSTAWKECTRVRVTPTSGSAPVFFDYSRLWGKFLGAQVPTRYPRPLVTRTLHEDRTRISVLKELLARDAPPGPVPVRSRIWHLPSGLPRSQQRLLDWGIVQSRTFLNVETLPSFRGRIPGELVFITGTLRTGISGAEVLARLNESSNASPFLLMDDGQRMIAATLGQIAAVGGTRKRVPSTSRPVLSTLSPLVDDVQVTIERTDSLRKTVDHRYDRLIS